MALKSKFIQIRNNSFVRSVSVLAGGTAFAQVIMLLALPVITRLYTPNDFSVLAVYAALLAILSVVACLRFDIAIPLPEADVDAVNILAVALLLSITISALVSVPFIFMPEFISSQLNHPRLAQYLWLVPLGVFLNSSNIALQYWIVRRKKFSTIAKTRIGQSTGGAGTQLIFGWLGLTPLGLILGQMISSGAGIFSLGYSAAVDDKKLFANISWRAMGEQIRRYERFPKYSTFDALFNSGGTQIPLILIAALAAGPEAGYLILAMRVMQAPMGLVGSAVSQVFLSHAADEHRNGNLPIFTSQMLVGLMKAGVGPLIFIGFMAPVAIPFVFGEEWRRTGELVSWMTPWFVMQFLGSPISMVMHVCEQQRSMLLLNIGGLMARVGLIGVAVILDLNILSESYAVASALYYLAVLFVCTKTAGIRFKEFGMVLKESSTNIVVWIVITIILYFWLV